MQNTTDQYFKYLTVSEDDTCLGVYLEGAGYETVASLGDYPLPDHAASHFYHWETGRRLSAYQILYMTHGSGVFESELTGAQTIKAGDVFVLFPGVWHRFRPYKETGWTIYWIEFNGKFADHYRDAGLLPPEKPVLSVGIYHELFDLFAKAIDLIKEEKMAFQHIASGIIIQIIGQTLALKKGAASDQWGTNQKIRMARMKIHQSPEAVISPEGLAREVDMEYSYFRKKFKEETGFSPAQYQIQTRINKAKNLLSTTNFTIKEVGRLCGFESENYFSRLFRKKTGITPVEFRDGNRK